MRRVFIIVAVLLILAGVAVFAYPWVSAWFNEQQSLEVIELYDAQSATLSTSEIDEQFVLAEGYNLRVSGLMPYDPFTSKEPVPFPDYEEILDPGGNGVMASVEIPAINCKLPIYHGVADAVLQRGIGHMPTTALPVGGEGTHSVLVGHNGLPTRELLTNLEQVQLGDAVIITVLGRKLGYRVDQILVVEPESTEALLPVAGEDYLSLVTCTPYGINSHRLLVRGVRDDTVIGQENGAGPLLGNSTLLRVGLATAALMVALALLTLLVRRRLDRRAEAAAAAEAEAEAAAAEAAAEAEAATEPEAADCAAAAIAATAAAATAAGDAAATATGATVAADDADAIATADGDGANPSPPPGRHFRGGR
jgi:sortase A